MCKFKNYLSKFFKVVVVCEIFLCLLLLGTAFADSYVKDGDEFQVNTYTTDSQGSPVISSIDGGFVVVWQSFGQDGNGSGIYGQRYDVAGVPQGGEFQVNVYTTSNQEYSAVSSIDGGFVVVWQSNGQDGDYYGIYGKRYNNEGVPQGNEFRVNTYTNNYQSNPAISSIDGGFVVVWQSYGQDGDDYGIYGKRYNNEGIPQGSEFQVNTYTTSIQRYPAISSIDSGFVVVWQSDDQDGDDWGVYGQRYDNEGVPQGGEFYVNVNYYGPQMGQTVSSIDNGFVVVWYGSGDNSGYAVYGKRYDNEGVPQGSEFQVNTYTSADQGYSAVSSIDGGFVVVWNSYGQDGSAFGVYGQRYNNAGVPQGSEFQVNTYTNSGQLYPSVSLIHGGFVVVWQSDDQDGDEYGIYGQRYLVDRPAIHCIVDMSYTEDSGTQVIDSSIVITDPGNTHMESATIQISANYQSGEDILGFTDQLGITGSWNSGTGMMILTGSATKADYETALESITYENTSENPNPADRTISWIISDGEFSSSPVTSAISINSVNDLPIVNKDIESQSIKLGDYYSFTLPSDTFFDEDGDELIYRAYLADGSDLPGWLYFDSTELEFSGTPSVDLDAEKIEIFIEAEDPSGAKAEASFYLTLTEGLWSRIKDKVFVGATVAGVVAVVGFIGKMVWDWHLAGEPGAVEPGAIELGAVADLAAAVEHELAEIPEVKDWSISYGETMLDNTFAEDAYF